MTIEALISLIADGGLSMMITGLLIYAVTKYLPEYFVERKQDREDQRQYYATRQAQYDEQNDAQRRQMEEQAKLHADQVQAWATAMERSNQVIGQNTAAMDRNSRVISETKQTMTDVTEASRETTEEVRLLRDIVAQLKIMEGSQ